MFLIEGIHNFAHLRVQARKRGSRPCDGQYTTFAITQLYHDDLKAPSIHISALFYVLKKWHRA